MGSVVWAPVSRSIANGAILTDTGNFSQCLRVSTAAKKPS